MTPPSWPRATAPVLAQQDASLDALGLPTWADALLVLAVGIVLASAARTLIRRYDDHRAATSSTVAITARIVFVVIVCAAAYAALRTLGLDLRPVLVSAGVLGVALALALRDIGENYIAGVILGFRNPFRPGDQIVSGDHEGTVQDLNLRYTLIRAYDGTLHYLPNSTVLGNPLVNKTAAGPRRTSVRVRVAYGTDLALAKRTALAAAAGADGTLASPAPEAWLFEYGPSSVDLCVRFWHAPQIAAMWSTRDAVVAAVYAAFEAEGIVMPFEQVAVHAGERGAGWPPGEPPPAGAP